MCDSCVPSFALRRIVTNCVEKAPDSALQFRNFTAMLVCSRWKVPISVFEGKVDSMSVDASKTLRHLDEAVCRLRRNTVRITRHVSDGAGKWSAMYLRSGSAVLPGFSSSFKFCTETDSVKLDEMILKISPESTEEERLSLLKRRQRMPATRSSVTSSWRVSFE